MTTLVVLLVLAVVVALGIAAFGGYPAVVRRRRVIVERPVATERIVERPVAEAPAARRPTRRRVVEEEYPDDRLA